MEAPGRIRRTLSPVWARNILLLVLAAVAFFTRLNLMRQFGPGQTPDSAIYDSVAANLLAGSGFVSYDGAQLTLWAPFYAVVLAAIQAITGAGPLFSVPWLNSFLFACIVFFAGILCFRHLESPLLALFGTLALLVSLPLFEVTLMLWSESLFIALTLLFLILFENYQQHRRWWLLLVAGIVVGLATLTRYVGFVLVPVGVICIWFLTDTSRKTRLRALVLFVVSALVLVGPWLFRNFILTGYFFGGRGVPYVTLIEGINLFFDVTFAWYVADINSKTPLAFLFIGAILGLVIGFSWRDGWIGAKSFLKKHGDLLVLVICYVSIVIYQMTTSNLNPLDNRLMSPMVAPIGILLLVLIENLIQRIVPSRYVFAATGLVVIVLFFWLAHPFSTWKRLENQYTNIQGLGWNQKAWRTSATVQYLQTNPLDCAIFTNAADIIWLRANLSATLMLRPPRDALKKGKVCVVLFDGVNRGYVLKLDDLRKIANVTESVKLADGTIYNVSEK